MIPPPASPNLKRRCPRSCSDNPSASSRRKPAARRVTPTTKRAHDRRDDGRSATDDRAQSAEADVDAGERRPALPSRDDAVVLSVDGASPTATTSSKASPVASCRCSRNMNDGREDFRTRSVRRSDIAALEFRDKTRVVNLLKRRPDERSAPIRIEKTGRAVPPLGRDSTGARAGLVRSPR
jgi:hypothetical protein